MIWITLIVLAAAGLAGQYIAYQFDDLARQDAYRPWFQELCPKLGCTVPSPPASITRLPDGSAAITACASLMLAATTSGTLGANCCNAAAKAGSRRAVRPLWAWGLSKQMVLVGMGR